jgi:hypothetical protein
LFIAFILSNSAFYLIWYLLDKHTSSLSKGFILFSSLVFIITPYIEYGLCKLFKIKPKQ